MVCRNSPVDDLTLWKQAKRLNNKIMEFGPVVGIIRSTCFKRCYSDVERSSSFDLLPIEKMPRYMNFPNL